MKTFNWINFGSYRDNPSLGITEWHCLYTRKNKAHPVPTKHRQMLLVENGKEYALKEAEATFKGVVLGGAWYSDDRSVNVQEYIFRPWDRM